MFSGWKNDHSTCFIRTVPSLFLWMEAAAAMQHRLDDIGLFQLLLISILIYISGYYYIDVHRILHCFKLFP